MIVQNALNRPNFVIEVRQQILTSSGTYTPPSNLINALVRIVGGGGGGGGMPATASNQASCVGTSGSAAWVINSYTLANLSPNVSYTVGAGGAGGAAGQTTGSVGGSTTWVSSVAGGGGASTGGVASTGQTSSSGGLGGSATAGGGNSSLGFIGSGMVVAGTTPRARRTRMPSSSIVQAGYGGGALGRFQVGSSAAQAGIAGQPGVIIITEFLRRV